MGMLSPTGIEVRQGCEITHPPPPSCDALASTVVHSTQLQELPFDPYGSWILWLDSFGVVAVLDAFESSLSVALNSPRRRRVPDRPTDFSKAFHVHMLILDPPFSRRR
eukprot:2257283-Prymnesium_polylepis.2